MINNPVDALAGRALAFAAAMAKNLLGEMTTAAQQSNDWSGFYEQALRVLLGHESMIGEALADSTIAAFLLSTKPVLRALPPVLPPLPTVLPIAGQAAQPPRPPLPPSSVIIGPGKPGGGQPILRFPLIEHAAKDLANRGVMTRPDFDRLDMEARRQAFTVARIQTLDTLDALRDNLAKQAAEGGSFRDFKRDAAAILAETQAPALTPSHLETVYRTNMASAYSAGQQNILANPVINQLFPYVLWTAVHDWRTEDTHLAMEKAGLNGTAVYRADDPLIRLAWPPARWNCFLPGTEIQGGFLSGFRMRYSGQAIEVRTRSGKRLAVTGNHPILTDQGFVPANTLRKGQHVLSYSGGIENGPSPNGFNKSIHVVARTAKSGFPQIDHNNQHAPTLVEQVFASLANVTDLHVRKRRPGDFHGDAMFGQGDIDVVGSIVQLRLNMEADRCQCGGDFRLKAMNKQAALVSSCGTNSVGFRRINSASRRSPCVATLTGDRSRIGFDRSPFEPLSIGPAAMIEASRYEPFLESRSGNTHFLGENIGGLAGNVAAQNFIGDIDARSAWHYSQSQSLAVLSKRDTSAAKYAAQARVTDADFIAQLNERFASAVTLDEIVEIREFQWSGHVYDFQTTNGWIVADGIFTSNCRCHVIPLSIKDAARRGVREAIEWLASGNPPIAPEYVQSIPLKVPAGWSGGAPTAAQPLAA